jgi:hypothetical protein
MPNAAKPGRATLLAAHRSSPEGPLDRAEASESAQPAPGGGEPPALPRPAPGLREAFASNPSGGSAPERPPSLRKAIAEETREPAAAPPSIGAKPSGPHASPRLYTPRLSGRLAALAETAKAYARSAQADNTQRAYASEGARTQWEKP